MRKRVMRRALYGWMFYTPPVLLIIGVLAFDAWLNIETRRNDYEVAELKAQAIQLNDALEKLRGQSAANQQMQKLQEQAVVMGLHDPEPWQVERVSMPGPIKPAAEFKVAREIPAPPALPERPTIKLAPAPAPVQPVQEMVMADAEPAATAAVEGAGASVSPSAPEHMALSIAPVAEEEMPAGRAGERAAAALLGDMPVHSPVALAIPDETPETLDESVESMLAL